MRFFRATYGNWYLGVTMTGVGAVLTVIGMMRPGFNQYEAIGGRLFLAGVVITSTWAVLAHGFASAHHLGYRNGRRIARPVVVSFPARDDDSHAGTG